MELLGFGVLAVFVVGLFWVFARLLSRAERNSDEVHGNPRGGPQG